MGFIPIRRVTRRVGEKNWKIRKRDDVESRREESYLTGVSTNVSDTCLDYFTCDVRPTERVGGKIWKVRVRDYVEGRRKESSPVGRLTHCV